MAQQDYSTGATTATASGGSNRAWSMALRWSQRRSQPPPPKHPGADRSDGMSNRSDYRP
jgi:hypothetical protein